jgi:hypothetical protein
MLMLNDRSVSVHSGVPIGIDELIAGDDDIEPIDGAMLEPMLGAIDDGIMEGAIAPMEDLVGVAVFGAITNAGVDVLLHPAIPAATTAATATLRHMLCFSLHVGLVVSVQFMR